MLHSWILRSAVILSVLGAGQAWSKPVEYAFDIPGAHAFVQFRTKHLGISWLYGQFDDFDGRFVFDPENDQNNKVTATVNIDSLDSNHAERDVHLRKDDFLNVKKFKTASFKSSQFKTTGDNKGTLTGELTLMGVTKTVTFSVDMLGTAVAPWEKGKGIERIGFQAEATIKPQDFGMKAAWVGPVELIISVEGVSQP